MSLAETSECRMRHGAVVVKGGSVLGCGINRTRNHPLHLGDSLAEDSGTSTHAETRALQQTRVTKGATIYIARINKSGEPLMSRPCDTCFLEIHQSGIKEVIYTIG